MTWNRVLTASQMFESMVFFNAGSFNHEDLRLKDHLGQFPPSALAIVDVLQCI